MKKILAILLVCTMALGLTACGNSGWKTKKVALPDVTLETREVVAYTDTNGSEVKDTLIASPMTTDAFNPEAAAESLKKLESVKDWDCSIKYAETGIPYTVDGKQLTAYQYATSITLSEQKEHGQSIVIKYNGNTDIAIGWSSVSVEVSVDSDGKMLKQAQILEVLKVVYGDTYANYLCYAPMVKEEELSHNTLTYGTNEFYFERYVEKEYGVSFVAYVLNTDETQVNGTANGFTPDVELEKSFTALLFQNKNDTVLDVANMGKDFLAKFYGEGAHFTPSGLTGAYLVSKFDNTATLMANYTIAQEGVAEQDRLGATWSVTKTGDLEEVYVNLKLARLTKVEVTDDTYATFKQTAQDMVKEILGVEELTEDVFADDASCTVTLNGQEVLVMFRFYCDTDDAGNEVITLAIGTSTDLNALNK